MPSLQLAINSSSRAIAITVKVEVIAAVRIRRARGQSVGEKKRDCASVPAIAASRPAAASSIPAIAAWIPAAAAEWIRGRRVDLGHCQVDLRPPRRSQSPPLLDPPPRRLICHLLLLDSPPRGSICRFLLDPPPPPLNPAVGRASRPGRGGAASG
uniref:Uncharacterized protein K0155C03.34 n=1 Tax=Oryza sativa subsp. indica TaxID=39946 RepID=C8TFH3_ORYSI|nr:hypothetical protein [Oryza sativa Indica Group]